MARESRPRLTPTCSTNASSIGGEFAGRGGSSWRARAAVLADEISGASTWRYHGVLSASEVVVGVVSSMWASS